MKQNKKLKKLADESMKDLLNDDFKKTLMAQQQENKNEIKKESKYASSLLKWKICLSVAASLLIIVVVISCLIVFIPKEKNEKAIPHYAYDDEIAYPSDLNSLNSILQGYKIKDEFINKISIVKDSKSGDELYYILIWEDDFFKSCRIDFVVNEYYEYFAESTNEIVTINGLEIKSSSKSTYYSEEGIYINERFASTIIGNVKVYFNIYESWTLSQDDEFDEFIQNIFIKE